MDDLTKLRQPFPPEAIGKLPKAGTHLDYVGHAAVTDRLLSVDPGWSWEPFACDDTGLPAVIWGQKEASLWIRLTVCGVTRIGVGTAAPGAAEVHKQLIGDAIRNAAMRFGVALDLWTKDELESQVSGQEPQVDPRVQEIARYVNAWGARDERMGMLKAAREKHGWPSSLADYDPDQLDACVALVRDLDERADGAPEPQPDVEDPAGTAGEAGQADEQGDGGHVRLPAVACERTGEP